MSADDLTEDITSFIISMRAVDERALDDTELAARCLAATTLLGVVQAHVAELAAEFHERGAWAADGAASGPSWLAARCRVRRAEIVSLARVGRAVRRLPTVVDEAMRGEIGFDHVRRIADCARRDPNFDLDDEAFLLEHARTHDPDIFRMIAREWRSKAEDASADEAPIDEPSRREFVHLSQTFDGWYRLDGELSPANGAIVAAFFDEFVDKAMRAQRDGDPSLERMPASGLRAEGLTDVVAQHQRREPSDTSAPDRYRVAIIIRPGESVLEACDADRYRAVIDAEGEVLDIGRASREWTVGIRRAIAIRDNGCVFPGCDRPPSWCDVHHCQEWDNSGPTCRDNGALLCRRHHTFIHAKRWRVSITTPRGKPQVLQPDGTPFTIARYRTGLPALN